MTSSRRSWRIASVAFNAESVRQASEVLLFRRIIIAIVVPSAEMVLQSEL
jgi:hypothetical protein